LRSPELDGNEVLVSFDVVSLFTKYLFIWQCL